MRTRIGYVSDMILHYFGSIGASQLWSVWYADFNVSFYNISSFCQFFNDLHVLFISMFLSWCLFSQFIRQGCRHKLQESLILIRSVIWTVECLVLGQIWYVSNTFLSFHPFKGLLWLTSFWAYEKELVQINKFYVNF
jgi:hypothetical protein